jgi:serine/threonine protein kinase
MAGEVPPQGWASALPRRLQTGDRIAGYEVVSFLTRGGMAELYEARDLRLGRRVALKLIASDLAQDERFRARFMQESQLAASLDHPNIVPIYEAGDDQGLLFLAMRYVDGADFADVLRERSGPLPSEDVLSLLRQAARALDAAHEAGLVHRDVKPANILVTRAQPGHSHDRHVYLTDFGITKRVSSLSGLTTEGRFLGTVEYVAPEQVRGQHVEAAADIYSLACMAFQALTGELPFVKEHSAAILFAHVAEQPPAASTVNPDLPVGVDAALAAGLAKEPTDRPQSCVALIEAIDEGLRTAAPGGRGPVLSPAPSPPPAPLPVPTWPVPDNPPSPTASADPRSGLGAAGSRRRLRWPVVAGVVVLVLAVAVVMFLRRGESFATYDAADPGAPVRVEYPASWGEHAHRDFFVVLSPLALQPVFNGSGWAPARQAGAGSEDLVGAMVRIHRGGYTTDDPAVLEQAIRDSDLAGNDVTFGPTSRQEVAGQTAARIDGMMREPGGDVELQFEAYVLHVGSQQSDSLTVLLFAAPAHFGEQRDAFDRILRTLDVTPAG